MKKLIVVCEEKLHRYGDFLAQLISSNDDKEENVVGVKDGSVAAQVWTEKEYTANAAQISSEQYIIFIGNSKLMKEKRFHMQRKYSEYGMNYGWLGKQASMFVDEIISFEDYEAFFQLVLKEFEVINQKKLSRLLPSGEQPDSDNKADNIVKRKKEKAAVKLPMPLEKAHSIIKNTTEAGRDKLNKVVNGINTAIKGNKLEDQQYTCLVLLFYLHNLETFLGLSEA